ncbi:MAG: molybdenum cofactor guanylyltransferase [Phycisphaerae bacterium]
MPPPDPSHAARRPTDLLKVGAVVLAGGHGRRIGQDKASLRLGDLTALARVCETALTVVDTVVVAARTGQALPEMPSGIAIVVDPIPDCGPLGGMLAGFRALSERSVAATLVLACDHPLVTAPLLHSLIDGLDANPAVAVRHNGRCYPLLAAYRLGARQALEQTVAQRNLRAMTFLDSRAPAYLEGDALCAADPQLQSLININDAQQWEAARRALRRTSHGAPTNPPNPSR